MKMNVRVRLGASAVVLVAFSLVATACSSNDDVSHIDDVWSRASASVADAAAVYMIITGGSEGDSLVDVSVDASVAGVAELHESSMAPNAEGVMMMSMQHVPSIAVPANGTAVLEPGGFHVMLTNLVEPLVAGSDFEVTLTFESAGDVVVSAEVREG
jgi:hypothetical protein